MKLIKQRVWRDNSENILNDFLENQASMAITDTMGRVIYANNKFCDLVEIAEKRICGELNPIFMSEHHANPVYKEMWKTIRSGKIWKGLLSGVINSGKLYKLEVTILPGKNSKGDIDRFIGFYFDVEPKSDVFANINSNEVKSESYPNSIAKSAFTINSFGEITYSSQGFRNLSPAEVEGYSFYSFITPIFHDMVKHIIKDVFETGKPDQFETVGVSSEGVNTIFVSQIGPVINNRGVVVSATISTQEVRDLSKVNKNLMEREAKYHALFKNMNAGILVVVNEAGRITEWNHCAERVFGYSEKEVMGEYLTKLIANPNKKTSLIKMFNAVKDLEDFASSEMIEMKGLKKNGSECIVECRLSKWENDGAVFYCAMMQDITKQKKLESKLKSKTKELELFLYKSSHDLKAPLSSAEGLLNLIKQEEVNDEVLNLTSMLDLTLIRGKGLVDSLILASEISERKKNVVAINFTEIVSDVLKSLNVFESYCAIDFEIAVEDAIEYYSSPELIKSLFLNLIQNAIKYRVPNNYSRKPKISIQVKESQNTIKIEICDNGIGVLKKNLSKIFNLYYRENIEETPGFGLGLYIVKNIVEDLKGVIRVNSKVNEGTCFKIKLNKTKYVKTA
ncbi:PAS domain S-box protein [Mariniflexile sp.]|uniref:PAS domain-containing protein n=1 Tax=Mariniflexile sp. TaxID=1979402 RepID=UPI00356B206F